MRIWFIRLPRFLRRWLEKSGEEYTRIFPRSPS